MARRRFMLGHERSGREINLAARGRTALIAGGFFRRRYQLPAACPQPAAGWCLVHRPAIGALLHRPHATKADSAPMTTGSSSFHLALCPWVRRLDRRFAPGWASVVPMTYGTKNHRSGCLRGGWRVVGRDGAVSGVTKSSHGDARSSAGALGWRPRFGAATAGTELRTHDAQAPHDGQQRPLEATKEHRSAVRSADDQARLLEHPEDVLTLSIAVVTSRDGGRWPETNDPVAARLHCARASPGAHHRGVAWMPARRPHAGGP